MPCPGASNGLQRLAVKFVHNLAGAWMLTRKTLVKETDTVEHGMPKSKLTWVNVIATRCEEIMEAVEAPCQRVRPRVGQYHCMPL